MAYLPNAIMPDRNIFDRYLLALRETPVDEKTEHMDRAALQSLLRAIADCRRKRGRCPA
jgi:hypothetical protein